MNAPNQRSSKANGKPARSDQFQTPNSGTDVIIPHLKPNSLIWEPCAAQGYMARRLAEHGHRVVATELLEESYVRENLGDPVFPVTYGVDFLTTHPNDVKGAIVKAFGGEKPDYIVTNFPFTIAHKCVERCYRLGIPWAAIMKLEVWGTQRIQKWFRTYGNTPIILDKRIAFKPPIKSWAESSAWFPVAWFTSMVIDSKCYPGKGLHQHAYGKLSDAETLE